MGLVDKLKNLFTEEVVEEKPIKKEVIQVEIPAPKSIKEEVEEEQEFKNTPIFFDDDDFKDLEEKEVRSEYKRPIQTFYQKKEIEERVFKPSPIISPVYGVLNKNYLKEEVVNKKPTTRTSSKENVTIDEVRKKAFGTLEDDLENTLTSKTSFLFTEEPEIKDTKKDIDIFEELEKERDVETFEDIEDNGITGDDLFDTNGDYYEEEDELTIDEMLSDDNYLDNDEFDEKEQEEDLFDLIDSMYDKDDE